MKKYIVGYINFFDNDLLVEIVEANNWKDALSKHSHCKNEDGSPDDMSWLSEDIESAKYEAFNADFMFDVKEI